MLEFLFIFKENLVKYLRGCFEGKTIKVLDVLSCPFIWRGLYFYYLADLLWKESPLQVN